jgi:hypothetical protein
MTGTRCSTRTASTLAGRRSVLVWQAATRDMNATVPQAYLDAHVADDAARASRLHGAVSIGVRSGPPSASKDADYPENGVLIPCRNSAQFRSDLQGYVQREVIEACIGDFFELPPKGTSNNARFRVISAVAERAVAALVPRCVPDRERL